MRDSEALRALLPRWIEHNDEHAAWFREWALRNGEVDEDLLEAARLLEKATALLRSALEELSGPLLPEKTHRL